MLVRMAGGYSNFGFNPFNSKTSPSRGSPKPGPLGPDIYSFYGKIKEISGISKIKEEENWEFRSFLKGYDVPLEALDSMVHELLEYNICTQYQYRPKDCMSYPHLHKEDFVFRLMGVMENYSICPIVFNVYEQLKEKVWDEYISD